MLYIMEVNKAIIPVHVIIMYFITFHAKVLVKVSPWMSKLKSSEIEELELFPIVYMYIEHLLLRV